MRLWACAAVLGISISGWGGVAHAEDRPGRFWGDPITLGGSNVYDLDAALTPGGRIVSVQQRTDDPWRIGAVETRAPGSAETEEAALQPQGAAGGYYPTVATLPTGGSLAAWTDASHVYVAEDNGGPWTTSVVLPGGQTDYSDGRPRIATNQLGDVIIAWVRKDYPAGQRIWIAERLHDEGAWREPRVLADETPVTTEVLRSLDLSDEGRVGLGFLRGESRTGDMRAAVRFGRIGGPFEETAELPGAVSAWSWDAPKVALDGFGNAAIAWVTRPDDLDVLAGPLHIAVRNAAGVIGPARSLGQTDDHVQLVVSDVGEVIAHWPGVTDISTNGDGSWGYSLSGELVVHGSATTGYIGSPQVIAPWTTGGSALAMNARGDAVFAYAVCCPTRILARRRAAGTPFGPWQVIADGEIFSSHDTAESVGSALVQGAGVDLLGDGMVWFAVFNGPPAARMAVMDGPLATEPIPGRLLDSWPLKLVPEAVDPIFPSPPSLPFIAPPPSVPPYVPATRTVTPLRVAANGGKPRGVPRRLRIRMRCDADCRVLVTGRVGRHPLGLATTDLAAGQSRSLRIEVPRKARLALRRTLRRKGRASARVSIRAWSSRGVEVRRAVRVVLRRR
jgi:hypothetical protein